MTRGCSSLTYYYEFFGRASALITVKNSYILSYFPIHHFIGCKSSMSVTFPVPLTLSVHIPLGHLCGPVCAISPVTI